MSRAQVRLGKRFEEQVAEAVGGTRVIRSCYGESAPDIEHPLFIAECKVRASLAVSKWMQQAESYRDDERPAVLFCREKGARLDDSLVIVRLPVFLEMMNRALR